MHPIVNTAWNAIPRPIQDSVASLVDRVQGAEIPAPPAVPSGRAIRVYIGPTNYAGQGYRWARASEENPEIVARTMVTTENNPFDYEVDYSVRWRTMNHSRRWQRDLLKALTTDYTHVLIEAEMPLLGGMFNNDIRRQVAALRAGGVKVGMICHGTDIRLPSRHGELERWSYLADNEWTPVDRLEKEVQGNLDLLEDLAAPIFVSTAGLLLDVPSAHLLPVVIKPELWSNNEPLLERSRPRVLHIPSNPLLKGTLHIAPVMEKLHDEGLIEYVQVIGRTHAEMPALFASADIVLDQFRVGDYGVASCEAMASGRIVVAHVSDQVREVVMTETGHDLPIVEATIDSLEHVVRNIVSRPEHFRSVAENGPRFVRHTHDGRLSRAALEKHFFLV